MWPKEVFTRPNSSRPSSSEPVVAARKPMPRCRLPRIPSWPRSQALMPPRTSLAMWRQVARSASMRASGRWPLAGSSLGLRRPLTITSQRPTSVTARRTRALPSGTSIADGS